jgi:hypothetical protein
MGGNELEYILKILFGGCVEWIQLLRIEAGGGLL